MEQKSRKISPENYIHEVDELLTLLDTEIDARSRKRGDAVRLLQKIRQSVHKLRTDVRWITRRTTYTQPILNGFQLPIRISDELKSFLTQGFPKETDFRRELTRVDVTRALCTYCYLSQTEQRPDILAWAHLNPTFRDLRNPDHKQFIIPDEALNKLLRYDEYVHRVHQNEIVVSRKNKDTGAKEDVIITDPSLTYAILQKLISCHILK